MKRSTRFRLLVEAPEILLLPGVHDALTLRLAEQAGFEAVTCGGYAATASLLGVPDMAQLGMSEMAEMYARLCDQTELPVFADADTGYGGTANVARTVRAFERAGVAGLFIEDQLAPKRCGHMKGKQVVPAVEMVAKIKAALDARRDGDLVVMARTDARAVEGLEAAVERAQIYREAGADVLFVEALRSREDMEMAATRFAGRVPLLANMVEGGKTPVLPAAELEEIGFRIAIFPGALVRHVAFVAENFLEALRQDGNTARARDRMFDFTGLNAVIGTPELLAQGKKYDSQ